MRLLKLYTAALVLICAQMSYGQNCPDDVSTDPRNPSNSDRPDLENTFFWFPLLRVCHPEALNEIVQLNSKAMKTTFVY